MYHNHKIKKGGLKNVDQYVHVTIALATFQFWYMKIYWRLIISLIFCKVDANEYTLSIIEFNVIYYQKWLQKMLLLNGLRQETLWEHPWYGIHEYVSVKTSNQSDQTPENTPKSRSKVFQPQ